MTAAYAEHLARASGEALVALSPDGEVKWWGEGAAALFGADAAEAVGRPLAALCGRVVEGQPLDEVLDEARVTYSAVWTATLETRGRVVHLEAVFRRVEPEGWLSLVGRDVSERVRMTRELLERTWQLEARLEETSRLMAETDRLSQALVQRERLAAIGELAAGIGHDLRNPLAAIKNAVRYLQKRLDRDANEPRIFQFLDAATRELASCEQTIAGLLDYARDAPLVATTCAIPNLLTDAVGVVARPAHVTIEVEAAPELPTVEVDATQLRRALVNLVQNACEAIPPSRPGKVRAVAAASGDAVTIAITDDGDGISLEAGSRLFDPLFTTKARGTGLGLAVVARIIERHGGRITVESSAGRGSVFTVRLPLARREAP